MSGMNRSEVARAKWSRIVAAQRSSGLSVVRFCEERGIPVSSLFAWKRRLGPIGGGPAARPRGFVEALVFGADGEPGVGVGGWGWAGIAIELVGGRRIMVGRCFDRRVLVDVIDALESGGPGSGEGSAADGAGR
jgi:hypothetical protein